MWNKLELPGCNHYKTKQGNGCMNMGMIEITIVYYTHIHTQEVINKDIQTKLMIYKTS